MCFTLPEGGVGEGAVGVLDGHGDLSGSLTETKIKNKK